MAIGQGVALVMDSKRMKFNKICFNTFKVKAKVKVFRNHNNDDDDNNNDDDTRVIAIARPFHVGKAIQLKGRQRMKTGILLKSGAIID